MQSTSRRITLDKFSRYTSTELEAICEFNPDMEVELHKHEGGKYLRIKNVLKRPDDLAEFCSKFPCQDRNKSIELGQSSPIKSKAPGFQQPIDDIYFTSLNKQIAEIGIQNNLVKYNLSDIKYRNYTNCCYPGMKAVAENYKPHVDFFSIAANFYLTDVKNTGTSFYKIETKAKSIYTDVDLSRRLNDPDIKAVYDEIISSKSFPPTCLTQEKYDQLMLEDDVVEDWIHWTGNHIWKRYLYVPAEYNSCLMYRGNIWHTITYDPTVEDVRYSLVSVIR